MSGLRRKWRLVPDFAIDDVEILTIPATHCPSTTQYLSNDSTLKLPPPRPARPGIRRTVGKVKWIGTNGGNAILVSLTSVLP